MFARKQDWGRVRGPPARGRDSHWLGVGGACCPAAANVSERGRGRGLRVQDWGRGLREQGWGRGRGRGGGRGRAGVSEIRAGGVARA